MAERLSKLIRRLRDARRLSQSDLAELAGLSTSYIAKAETIGLNKVRRTTVERLLGALNSAAPLTPDEYQEFLEAANLTHIRRLINPIVESSLADMKRMVDAALYPPTLAPEIKALISPREVLVLQDLIERIGIEGTMRAVLALHTPAATPRFMTVAHPPRVVDDHTEQVFTEYEVVPQPKEAAAEKPKGKDRRHTRGA